MKNVKYYQQRQEMVHYPAPKNLFISIKNQATMSSPKPNAPIIHGLEERE